MSDKPPGFRDTDSWDSLEACIYCKSSDRENIYKPFICVLHDYQLPQHLSSTTCSDFEARAERSTDFSDYEWQKVQEPEE